MLVHQVLIGSPTSICMEHSEISQYNNQHISADRHRDDERYALFALFSVDSETTSNVDMPNFITSLNP